MSRRNKLGISKRFTANLILTCSEFSRKFVLASNTIQQKLMSITN